MIWPGAGPRIIERAHDARLGCDTSARPGLEHPPDAYEVAAGQWSYDMDESTSVFKTGIRSLWFKNTATTPIALQDRRDNMVPVEAGRRFKAWAVFQADRNASGQNVDAAIRWYAADRETLISSSTIYGSPVTTAGDWQRADVVATVPSGASFARRYFGRSHSGTSFDAYFDEIQMAPAVPLWEVFMSPSTQSIPDSTETTVKYDIYDHLVDCTYAPTTGRITITVPGTYSITANARLTGLDDGDTVQGYLRVNGALSRYGSEYEVHAAGGAGTGIANIGVVAPTVDLNVGDFVEFRIWHNHGSSRNVWGPSGNQSWFTGTRIM